MLDIIDIDFKNPEHGRIVVGLLDEYASGDMGGNEPLSEFSRGNLVASLAARPWAHALAARVDGQPAGLAIYLEGFSTFACKPLLNLHDFMVSERFRGQGVAQKLLAALEDRARAMGCCKLTLEVLEGNIPARTLYQKMGFEGYQLQDEHGRALFWQKKLAA
ncbi:MAG TPA: GNAT family N-acetyltransferase [Bordetella sp.]